MSTRAVISSITMVPVEIPFRSFPAILHRPLQYSRLLPDLAQNGSCNDRENHHNRNRQCDHTFCFFSAFLFVRTHLLRLRRLFDGIIIQFSIKGNHRPDDLLAGGLLRGKYYYVPFCFFPVIKANLFFHLVLLSSLSPKSLAPTP